MGQEHENAVMDGIMRAVQDKARLRDAVYSATDEELQSGWWRFKNFFFAVWIGFTAPPLWTRKGRVWRKEMGRL